MSARFFSEYYPKTILRMVFEPYKNNYKRVLAKSFFADTIVYVMSRYVKFSYQTIAGLALLLLRR